MDEKDTSFLDCKHMHMMKNGAPPDQVGVLHRPFTYRIPWFHIKNYFLRVFTLWFTVLSQFLEKVWVLLTYNAQCQTPPRCLLYYNMIRDFKLLTHDMRPTG